jgi:hypothetical protein
MRAYMHEYNVLIDPSANRPSLALGSTRKSISRAKGQGESYTQVARGERAVMTGLRSAVAIGIGRSLARDEPGPIPT